MLNLKEGGKKQKRMQYVLFLRTALLSNGALACTPAINQISTVMLMGSPAGNSLNRYWQ